MSLRVFTAFSGYDSQLMALRNIGVDYECVGWSEIDKYTIAAHDAVFPDLAARNYGDITTIDWDAVPEFDLLTYSFPCIDISQAGRQAGLAEVEIRLRRLTPRECMRLMGVSDKVDRSQQA